MTLNKLHALSLLSLGLFAGCGDKDTPDDTSGDESEVPVFEICDDGVDNDEDGDIDCEQDDCCSEEACANHDNCIVEFEVYAMLMAVHAGYDGAGLSGYSGVDSNGEIFVQEEPWVELTFATEDYFATGDERGMCTWVGNIVENGLSSGGNDTDDLWIGFEVNFELFVDEQGQPYTDCQDFPLEWGDDRMPTDVVENLTWFVGWGRGSNEWRGELETAVGNAGLDWDADWDPFVFANWSGYVQPSSSEFVSGETGYAFGSFTDEDMMLLYDENDEGIAFQPRQTNTVPWGDDVDAGAIDTDGNNVYDNLPAYVVLNNGTFGGWLTDYFFAE